jgi:glutathionylspermidine synthase
VRRVEIAPRPDWVTKVEDIGLIYHHSADGSVYWDESAYYELTASEVATLEASTAEIQRLSLAAGQHIIDRRRYAELRIPELAIPLIEQAWEAEPPSIYGRLDLAFDGVHPPKLLEYNADTPTGLLEAAVVQWFWLRERFPDADQFNSIHERMVAKWRDLSEHLTGSTLYVTHLPDQPGEDLMTAAYLRETAEEAGITTSGLLIGDMGWDSDRRILVDEIGKPIVTVFKLYPWEWLMSEQFAVHLAATHTQMQWIEPIWKMLWSNKGLLPILWELFPNHPNLLPAYPQSPRVLTDYVKKPLLSREGSNVTVHRAGEPEIVTPGEYGEEGFVYQALAPLPDDGGRVPIVGSWLIDGEPAGIGIRESDGLVTTNTSRFVPHLFR